MITTTLINYLIYYGALVNSKFDGTTLSLVKIYNNCIHLLWIGDSKIQVYKNNNLWFTTPLHNCDNCEELKKIRNKNFKLEKRKGFKILDNENLMLIEKEKIFIDNDESISLTRCIGHNRILDDCFDEKILYYNFNDYCSIINASDGFWDVAGTKQDEKIINNQTTTARDLIKMAVKRWKQTWIVHSNYKRPYSQTFSKNCYDDIAIALWHNY